MTTNDTGTRVSIELNDSDIFHPYLLIVETHPDAPEDIFVETPLGREDVEKIAGWANPPKALLGTCPDTPPVRVGPVEFSLYVNNAILISTGYRESVCSWRLTKTASRKLIEEAGRWTR